MLEFFKKNNHLRLKQNLKKGLKTSKRFIMITTLKNLLSNHLDALNVEFLIVKFIAP